MLTKTTLSQWARERGREVVIERLVGKKELRNVRGNKRG